MSKLIPVDAITVSSPARPASSGAPPSPLSSPSSPTAGKKHVELAPIHDFARKLRQPEILPRLREYVRWQARARGVAGTSPEALAVPDWAPASINLDITTACNYACDHCVDMEILNQPIKYRHQKLLESLALMAEKGLRSVIVIGGGEPTVYPKFTETIRFMKALGLQVAIVSNGSGNAKIAEVADCMDENDWVRLSLDAGSDDVFVPMHKPKKPITLDEICAGVPPIKDINPRVKVGYSFIITWKGATINDTKIVENIHEIVLAAQRARDYRFDYIAYKPFLTRAESNHAEIVDLKDTRTDFDAVVARIRAEIDRAKELATPAFRIIETTNLKVLENKSYRDYISQPRNCHMQFFRQVLSPLGTYNCPVYRNQPVGKIGDKEAYAETAAYEQARRSTAERIRNFNATHECSEVTCLYNHVNWWIEDLIGHPEKLAAVEVESGTPDYFL